MPSKVVEVPGVGNVEFPDSMPDEAIAAVIRGQSGGMKPPAPNPMGMANQELAKSGISVAPPVNANQQTAQNMKVPGAVSRFLTSAAATLPSVSVKAGNPLSSSTYRDPKLDAALKGDASQAVAGNFGSDPTSMISEPAKQIGSGDIAGGLGTAAGTAAQFYATKKAAEGIQAHAATGPAGSELYKAAASDRFQQVLSRAGNVPVDLTEPGNIALRTQELAKSGGSMPKVMRDFISRTTAPNSPPLTYAEARDFYSNATRLSADEYNRLTPVMKRQVGMFTEELGKSIQNAASTVGEGDTYSTAMDQRRTAGKIDATNQKLGKMASKLVEYGIPATLAGYIAKTVIHESR